MKLLSTFILFGFFLTFSQNASAFSGCHQWCGNESNKEWCSVMESNGVSCTAPRTQQEPFRAAADAAKNQKFRECMAQTIAEGKSSDEECNGQSSSVPTPTSNPNACEQQYNSLIQQCDAQINSAKNTCDEKANSAIKNAQSSASSASTETTGVTDSCSGASWLNSSAKNAWTSYREQCSSGVASCQSKCGELVSWADSNPGCFPLSSGLTQAQLKSSVYSPKADQCLDLQAKVDSADQTIASYGSTADGANGCNTDTAGGESKAKSGNDTAGLLGQLGSVAASMLQKQSTASSQQVVAFCTSNPSYPGCGATAQVSCSDPTFAATNKVCQCAANPYACRVGESASTNGVSSFSSVDSSSRLPSQDANLSGDMPDVPGIQMGEMPKGGDVAGIDGRQGGAAVGSSAVGNGLGGSAIAKANVDPADVPSGAGTFGGGGGSGRFGSGAAAGGRGGYVPGGGAANPGGSPGSPDLRQFLPGGSFNARPNMIGGKVGIDGITGPNSNIWQKVQNRYQVLKDTLHP